MSRDFGWWQAVPRERALLNRVSGQRVRLLGVWLDEHEPEDGHWLRFDYDDDEVCYPVLARLTHGAYVDPQPPRFKKTGSILCVDHDRSARLWRRESGADASHPPYGLWRRVDDCITDALPCWPAIPPLNSRIGEVTVRGGWLNSTWREDLVRVFPGLTGETAKNAVTSKAFFEADEPYLLPLDAEPPSPWRFHGFPAENAADGDGLPVLERNAGFENSTKFYDEEARTSYYIVPADRPLTGMEGRIAYMAAEDASRVLYPKSGAISWEWGGTGFSYEYADSDFMGTIEAVNGGLSDPSPWSWNLYRLWGASRHGESGTIDSLIWVRSGVQVPPYRPWLKLSRTLIDAWLFWKGTRARFHDLIPELALVGASSITIHGRYLGGVWPAGMYCRAWLDGGSHDP